MLIERKINLILILNQQKLKHVTLDIKPKVS